MEDFFLTFSTPISAVKLEHGNEIVLMGSCFSDEIATWIKKTGHTTIANPFGTIFHPTALANNVMRSLNPVSEERIFERDNRFYSWDASTLISGETKEEISQQLATIKEEFKQALTSAKIIVVTFGTAWGYELNDTNEIVANCHKMPAAQFSKFLSSPYEMLQDWILAIEQIRNVNPSAHIVFTVSPVRHVKDGLVENNLSKARLIEVVQQLSFEENCSYFPSYELVIDVLRDYRFYKEDRVHPSVEAIKYVWKQFETSFCSAETKELNQKVLKVNQFSEHQSVDKEKHAIQIEQKKQELTEQHPVIKWY